MSSLINNRIEKLTHIYEYIYTFSVIHLVIHFLLENNTNKEAAYTMHKDQIIVIQKKNTQGVKKIQPNWKMTDHQWGNIAKHSQENLKKLNRNIKIA